MGQRLIIRNNVKGNVSHAIYYHNGAYTLDAIRIMKDLLHSVYHYMNQQKETPLTETALRQQFDVACFEAVSGVAVDHLMSLNYIKHLLSHSIDPTKVSRDLGMIAYDATDIDFYNEVGEYYVNIYWKFDDTGHVDITETTFDFFVVYKFTKEELRENWNMKPKDFKQLKATPHRIHLRNIPIDTLNEYLNELKYIDYTTKHGVWYDDETKEYFGIIRW